MSTLTLLGNVSGYSQIATPDNAGDQTFTLPGTGGTLDRLNRAGNVLQVVNATYSTQVTVSTTNYTDTGLTASITPSSSSSKIFVIINQTWYAIALTTEVYGGIRLLRDATVISTPVADGNGPYELGLGVSGSGTTTLSLYGRFALSFLDSPATTSSVTYKTQCRPYSTASSGSFAVNLPNATSSVTLLEVAA